MDALALFLQSSVQLGTPFLLATLGGIMCEKVGNLNLGVEGMMMMGAYFGFAAGYVTSSPFLAVLVGALGGALGALIYAIITITLKGNQIVTGFAMTIFGTGLANFLGQQFSGKIMNSQVTDALGLKEFPGLSNIPILGKMIFSQSIYVYMGIIIAIILFLYFKKTSFGLAARMVGESPATADASGISVDKVKYVHIILGGLLCGLGGAYLSTSYVPYWQDNITAGMGWIAVAMVIFSAWNPLQAIFSCYLFGALKAFAIKFQGVSFEVFGAKVTIASQVMDMLPYILTIIVLVITVLLSKKKGAGPASVGRAYFREDR